MSLEVMMLSCKTCQEVLFGGDSLGVTFRASDPQISIHFIKNSRASQCTGRSG